jgi:hypothetical protein
MQSENFKPAEQMQNKISKLAEHVECSNKILSENLR